MKDSSLISQNQFSDSFATRCHQLSAILTRYQQGKINAQLIKDALDFSQGIIEISKHSPHQLIAQLQFYRNSYSYSHNLVLNQVISTYLLLIRNRWNDTCIQHLLCVCVTQFAGVIHAMDQMPENEVAAGGLPNKKSLNQSNKILLKALTLSGFEVWLEGIKTAACRWHHKPLYPLRTIQNQSSMLQILAIGCSLGTLVTRHANSTRLPLHFSAALKKITSQLPPALYHIIDEVLSSPGLIPPGSFAKLKNEEVLLVLSTSQTGIIGKFFSKSSGGISGQIQLIPEMKISQIMAPQSLKKIALCDTWWDADWQLYLKEQGLSAKDDTFLRVSTFRIDTPPPTLHAIQQKLQHGDFDTNEITDLILQEPVFATHIKHTASQSSRENLVIQDVKHGLLMHGFERASSILMEHALAVRISQHQFPLRESLQQLTNIFKYCVSSIAEECNLLSSEQASCWASFACAGFFTNSTIKAQLTLQTEGCSGSQPQQLFLSKEHTHIAAHSHKLAVSWAQSPALIEALQTLAKETEYKQKRKPVKQLALMLGCSTILTRHIYFAISINSQEKQYLQQAFDELNILHIPYQAIINEALSRSHCFCPWSAQKRQ